MTHQSISDLDILVNLQGETVSLKKCSWLWVNPVGHVYGALSGEYATSADEAHAEFENDKRHRGRQREWGFTMELIPLEKFQERARPCMLGTCGHETPSDLKTCKLCGRIGKNDFHTVLDEKGKALLRCRARPACNRRRLQRYGRE